MDNRVYVKMNYKSLSEFKSIFGDKKEILKGINSKYIMGGGKYDKNGWSIVFSVKNVQEAQEIANKIDCTNSRVFGKNLFLKKKEVFS